MGWTVYAAPDFVSFSANAALDGFATSLTFPVSVPAPPGGKCLALLVLLYRSQYNVSGHGVDDPPVISDDVGLTFEWADAGGNTDHTGGPFFFGADPGFGGPRNQAFDPCRVALYVADAPRHALSGSLTIAYDGTAQDDPMGAALFVMAGPSTDSLRVRGQVSAFYREDIPPSPMPDISGAEPQPWEVGLFASYRATQVPSGFPFATVGNEIAFRWSIATSVDSTPLPSMFAEAGLAVVDHVFVGQQDVPRFRFRQRDDDYRAARIVSNAPTSRQKSNRRGPSNTYS